MDANTIAAWVGAVSGSLALLWDVYASMTRGPKIKLGVQLYKSSIFVNVTNYGDWPTTITGIDFFSYKIKCCRIRKQIDKHFISIHKQTLYQSTSYRLDGDQPAKVLPYKLNPGSVFDGQFDLVQRDVKAGYHCAPEPAEQLLQMVKKGMVFCQLHHSHDRKPVIICVLIQPQWEAEERLLSEEVRAKEREEIKRVSEAPIDCNDEDNIGAGE